MMCISQARRCQQCRQASAFLKEAVCTPPDQQVLDQYRPAHGGKSVSQFCENMERLQKPQEEHWGKILLGKRNLVQKMTSLLYLH